MACRIKRGCEIMKTYKKKIILTSAITLIPMVVGILLWNRLPDTIATHFNMDNVPNGWSSKAFTVFGLPMLLVVIHILAIGVTLNDPKKQNIGKKMLSFLFWIVPAISMLTCISIYGYALNMKVNMGCIVSLLVGVVFIIVGNYMSKNRQNYTVGIKLPWTLNSQENWNKTHRLASKMWVIAGMVFIVNIFFNSAIVIGIVIGLSVIIPMVYSFILYKKGI